MMPQITVTPETIDLLRQASTAPGGFEDNSVKAPDGNHLLELSDETFDRMQQLALPGETVDQTVSRITRAAMKQKPN